MKGPSTSPRRRAAFSLVEVLVALMLLGVGSLGLATGLAGDRRLRDLSNDETGAATRLEERIAALSVHPCATAPIDSGGATVERWGSERWRVTVSANRWMFIDSLVLRRRTGADVIKARVACPD